ncbi:MAG: hypothetical protein RLY31_179 [Bacteroidota bacterium]
MNKILLVLGMHRSGTSVATRILHTLGAAAPAHMLSRQQSLDNPDGYWEPLPLVKFHDALLAEGGLTWRNYYPLPDSWFRHPDRDPFRHRAEQLLAQEFAGAETGVFKCPRLCLLLPFWLPLLRSLGIEPVPVLLLRDPWDVARSLARRKQFGMKSFVDSPTHVALLWLRYTLAAERHTRGLPRTFIPYEQLEKEWRTAFGPFLDGSIGVLPPVLAEQAAEIDGFIRPAEVRRSHRPETSVESMAMPASLQPFRELKNKLQAADEQTLHITADRWAAAMNTLHTGRSVFRIGPAYDGKLAPLLARAVARLSGQR